MPRVFKRAAARRDLVRHYVYLVENAGDAVADRFLACAETSLVELSEHPEMGTALTLRRTELGAIRKWRDREFDNFLAMQRLWMAKCSCYKWTFFASFSPSFNLPGNIGERGAGAQR
jgi:toxin ParE1/3/4